MKMTKAFVMVRIGTTKYLGAIKTAKEEIVKMPRVANA